MPAIDRSCTDERSQRVCARIFLLAIESNDCTAIYKILDCFNRNDIVLDIDAFTDRYEKILRVSHFLHMLIELVCSGKANDKTLEKLFRYIELMDFRKFSLYPFAVEFPGVVKGMLLMLKNRITALIQDNGRAARVFHEMIKEKFDRKDFETMGERQEELIPLVEVLLSRLSTISDCGRDFGWSSSMSSSIAIEINRIEHEGK